ncbi:bifunctional 2-keto-4-hydroxyglutarate aldolase/2-keto-3-deoxy-6-phosphogluconate aldolase [Piscibacillus salipiscarius]|uniref:Bifunctional 2-keto-4-hydroxyglutarate aldolase/2-keto-3-deoxy-6-phosphogluconate aldolase n=1 Tax=Piscibacillus salipiscarius TaxID=299480 RepID=A0ABW5QBU3_9BACI|nr:bifunctional 2-keto-4-hydroxyglutarate aldolase/2-keto-3-deoxy-6-phosphogluconate aldolase [Piscibacillus salipiscarius]
MKQLKTLNKVVEQKLIAVIRAEDSQEAVQYSDAVIKGGFKAVELTYTTPGAQRAIEQVREEHPNVVVGAGTVLDDITAKLAIQAGAQFVVSPGFKKEIALLCNLHQVPYLPGCMTVSEMMTALQYGAQVIKLFPGAQFGPSAIKQFKGPLPDVSIMPTGGVNLENVNEWFENGAVAVGVGGSLTQGNLDEIEAKAKAFVEQVRG